MPASVKNFMEILRFSRNSTVYGPFFYLFSIRFSIEHFYEKKKFNHIHTRVRFSITFMRVLSTVFFLLGLCVCARPYISNLYKFVRAYVTHIMLFKLNFLFVEVAYWSGCNFVAGILAVAYIPYNSHIPIHSIYIQYICSTIYSVHLLWKHYMHVCV